MELTKDEKKDLRSNQIVLLVKTYYEKFDFLQYESLDLLIDKALNLFLDSDLSIEEINEKLLEAVQSRKKDIESRYDNDKIKDNHEELYGKLEQLFALLNSNGVDCQLAGALCGYLKYGVESDRCHDDIDICLNEEDMDKFRNICISLGLMFEDNRLDSPRVLKNGIPSGEHEVIARSYDSDFHIGVFCFERLEDGSVVNRGYYKNESGDPCVREEVLSPELSQELYGCEEVEFRGTPVTITPPEYVYCLKSYTKGEKDMHDVRFLEDKIDKEKVKRINELSKDGKLVQNVPVESVRQEQIHNTYNDQDDLGLMLADDEKEKKTDAFQKDVGKVLIKKDNKGNDNNGSTKSNQDGYATGSVLSTLGLISFVIFMLVFMTIYIIYR